MLAHSLAEESPSLLSRPHVDANFWTPAMDAMLKDWRNKTSRRHVAHAKLWKKYYRLGNLMRFIVFIVSGLATVSAILTLSFSSQLNEINVAITIVMSLIAISDTLTNYTARGEKYKKAYVEYESITSFIDTTLRFDYMFRGNAQTYISDISKRIDDINNESPPVGEDFDESISDVQETTNERSGGSERSGRIDGAQTRRMIDETDHDSHDRLTMELDHSKADVAEAHESDAHISDAV